MALLGTNRKTGQCLINIGFAVNELSADQVARIMCHTDSSTDILHMTA
jgi:hypothetical protein